LPSEKTVIHIEYATPWKGFVAGLRSVNGFAFINIAADSDVGVVVISLFVSVLVVFVSLLVVSRSEAQSTFIFGFVIPEPDVGLR
jgi:hypothetical protein